MRPQRSLRLEKRSAKSLDTLSGASGEIFYDVDSGTLRIYTNNAGEKVILATRSWVNDQVTGSAFSGDYGDLNGVPTALSSFTNNVGYITLDDIPPATDISTINNVGDVTITTPALDDILKWDGSAWVNVPAAADGNTTYSLSETSGVLTLTSSEGDTDDVNIITPAGGTMTNNLEFNDNISATFGEAGEFRIRHTGTDNELTATSGNIVITPAAGSSIVLDGVNWPQADGSENFYLKTDGAGQLSWASVDTDTNTTYTISAVDSGSDAIIRLTGSDSSDDDITLVAGTNITLTPSGDNITIAATDTGITDLVDDTTPQLGGNLDLNTSSIIGIGNISITGDVKLVGRITGPDSNPNLVNIDGAIYNRNINDSGVLGFRSNPGSDFVHYDDVDFGSPTSSDTIRVAWRNNSGQLAYIDPVGEWNGLPQGSGTNGIGIQTDTSNSEYALQITQNYGIIPTRETLRPYKVIAPAPSGLTDIDVFEFQGNGNYLWWLPLGSTNTWQINLTGVPEPDDSTVAPRLGGYNVTAKFMITQGATATLPNALQINGVSQTILWEGGVTPSATANGYDILEFDLLYFYDPGDQSRNWTVAGRHTSYS